MLWSVVEGKHISVYHSPSLETQTTLFIVSTVKYAYGTVVEGGGGVLITTLRDMLILRLLYSGHAEKN